MYNILCIDNDNKNLFEVSNLFENHLDSYKLIISSSLPDTLESLKINKIDLILLSTNDNFETAKIIKKDELSKDIPIIFLIKNKNKQTIKNSFIYGVDYLSKPYDEYELFTRIEVQLKLIESNNKLNEQISFTQSILDSQKHMIFIQDETKIIRANKRFLDFFKIDCINKFQESYNNIAELFMEYENYFSLKILNSNKPWMIELSNKHNRKNYNVLIMDIETFEPKAFKIDISTIQNSDKFVVVLTDITDLTTKTKHFENKATYDALTNIYNRSKFNEVLDDEIVKAQFEEKDLSFAIFDIDFFKKVNDNYGHIIGDKTLINFATTIQKHVRGSDTFARWGGEEFVLALVGANEENAFKVVDNLRKIIEETKFLEIGNITCSVGITQLQKNDKVDDMIKRADDALYVSKSNGRNIVSIK